MIELSRRSVLGGAAAALGSASWIVRAAVDPRNADLIVRNARVYTMEPSAPTAQAFAVRDGRILAAGSNDAIAGLAGKGTEDFNARGMTVVPGFIDCHLHPEGETLLYEVLVGNPFDVEFVTIDSIVAKLKERAAKTPPGEWVQGFFYDDTKVKDGRPLSRADLDRVSTVHPVAVIHRGGHTVFFNSKAFELAGVTKTTPQPFGGTFDHDEAGELNGRVTDNAQDVMWKAGKWPQYSEAETFARAKAGLAHISKQFARFGLTGVHHEGGNFSALLRVRQDGEALRLDVMLRPGILYQSEQVEATAPPTAFDTESQKTLDITGELEVEAFLLSNFSVSASTGIAYESFDPGFGGDKENAFHTIGGNFTNVGFHVYLMH